MMHSNIRLLYWLTFLDGFALLLLVVVAVPLKYHLDWPYGVKILGPTHGVLFISLTLTMIFSVLNKHITAGLGVMIFVASFIPLGAFYADYQLKKAMSNKAKFTS